MSPIVAPTAAAAASKVATVTTATVTAVAAALLGATSGLCAKTIDHRHIAAMLRRGGGSSRSIGSGSGDSSVAREECQD